MKNKIEEQELDDDYITLAGWSKLKDMKVHELVKEKAKAERYSETLARMIRTKLQK